MAKIDIPLILQVVDPSVNSLNVARERYLEIPHNDNINSIDFLTDIDNMNTNLDLCIIATNADIRFKVFQELVSKKNVSNIILEKVVFQTNRHFEEAKNLMLEKKISCWVNCPRRTFPIYKILKKHFSDDNIIECCVSGRDWGLACNGIHFIDLLSFFADDVSYQIDNSGLASHIRESKRAGFIEVAGGLTGIFSKGSRIKLECISNSAEELTISLNTSRLRVFLNESQGVGKIARKENAWDEEALTFKMPFQSELTHHVAKDILETGTCSLTDFDESFTLHKPYLEAIKNHVETVEQRKCECCQIT